MKFCQWAVVGSEVSRSCGGGSGESGGLMGWLWSDGRGNWYVGKIVVKVIGMRYVSGWWVDQRS